MGQGQNPTRATTYSEKVRTFRRLCKDLLVGAALLTNAAQSFGQGATPTSNYTNSFDTSSSVASWIYWYGSGYNNTAMTWDPNMEASTGSGSLQVYIPFGANGEQAVWFGTWHNQYGYDANTIYDGTKFTNITFDLLWTNNVPNLSGNNDLGTLQVGLVRQGWAIGGTFYDDGLSVPAAATNGWVHMNQVIDQASVGLSAVAGIDFKYTSYSGYPQFPVMFWIDNLIVHLSPLPPKPPALAAPSRPIPGLNLFSSSGNGDPNQRTGIKLIQNGGGTTWIGATGPVTYSETVSAFPNGATYPGYQSHVFLCSGASIPNYETAPDYNEANLVFLDIHQNADGTAYGALRYKINEPGANSNLYSGTVYLGPGPAHAGTLGYVGAGSVLGTWTMTFTDNTNVTLTAPAGGTFTTSFPEDISAAFAGPLNIIFGGQPNGAANFGQAVVLGSVMVANPTGTLLSDNFLTDTALDSSTWSILSGDANSVQLVPHNTGSWWVKWSLPDAGFGLQTTANFANRNSWTTLTGPEAMGPSLVSFASAASRSVLVPASFVVAGVPNYFRLLDQGFKKLQVLVPGETAAPGTPTGKTGAPADQTAMTSFDLTVNAVNNNWFLISANDTVHITSSDGSATLPADAPLVAGTATYRVTFNTAGNFIVAASDVTDASKASNTGSSTVVH